MWSQKAGANAVEFGDDPVRVGAQCGLEVLEEGVWDGELPQEKAVTGGGHVPPRRGISRMCLPRCLPRLDEGVGQTVAQPKVPMDALIVKHPAIGARGRGRHVPPKRPGVLEARSPLKAQRPPP